MSGVGIDIAAVNRLRALGERRPGALPRLFTPDELSEAGATRQRWPRLASRFAAKEALIKAAGGLHGSRYLDVEVRRRPGGSPRITVCGPLGEWLKARGLIVTASLSHEDEYAVAMVWLTVRGDDGNGPDMDC